MNVGVLLAAGASTRMGSPKALARWKGMSFLAHAARGLWTACDVVVVVLGASAALVRKGAETEFTRLVEAGELTKDLHAARKKGARALELRFEDNKAWKSGMLSSAKIGLKAALKTKPAALFVLPVDHPEVRPQTVAELAEVMTQALGAFGSRSKSFSYALVPRFRGDRGHPLVLSPPLARAIVRDRAAATLGDAVRRNARLVGYLDVRDGGVTRNRNTPAR